MRSGGYEVDAEGNLVEVGTGAPGGPPGDGEETPAPVRRAMRVYGFAQLVSFALLVVVAITMPEIRPVLLLVAIVYGVVAFFMHRLYRRALIRRYEKMHG